MTPEIGCADAVGLACGPNDGDGGGRIDVTTLPLEGKRSRVSTRRRTGIRGRTEPDDPAKTGDRFAAVGWGTPLPDVVRGETRCFALVKPMSGDFSNTADQSVDGETAVTEDSEEIERSSVAADPSMEPADLSWPGPAEDEPPLFPA